MKEGFLDTIPDDRGKREQFPCPACDGSGKMTIIKDGKKIEIDCNACGGTGKTNGH